MENLWNETEIKDLILYAKNLQEENEDLRAKMIMMNTALEREEKKVIRLNNMIKFLTNMKCNITTISCCQRCFMMQN